MRISDWSSDVCSSDLILRRHEPELVARLRIVATTDPAPVPLLVAGPDCAPEVAAALRQALLQVGSAPETAAIRDALCLSHFTTVVRSAEHTSELQSLMRISYAVFCLTKNKDNKNKHPPYLHTSYPPITLHSTN